MKFNQFTFLAMIAKHGNLTKASQELNVSQPSISQQLRLLERSYGVKLYRRSGKGIELTDSGRLLLSKVAPILEQVAQIKAIFPKPETTVAAGLLKIGGTFGPSTLLLPALAARFKRKHPDIEIELRTTSVQQLEQLLLNGQVEIAVSTHRPYHVELAWEIFRRERMVLFVSPTHPLARKGRVTIANVQAFPVVIRHLRGVTGTTARLLNELAARGLKFKIGMRCEAPYAIKEAVKKNAGIGIVFEDVVKREVERGEFKILKGHGLKLESDTYIHHRADRPLSASGQEFLTLLRKAHATRPATEMTARNSSATRPAAGADTVARRSPRFEPSL